MKVKVHYLSRGTMAMDVAFEDCFGADGLRFITTDDDGHHTVRFEDVTYEQVMDLDVDDTGLSKGQVAERVWTYLNDGEHAYFAGIRSMSVGDVVEFDDGTAAIARGFGFANIEPPAGNEPSCEAINEARHQ